MELDALRGIAALIVVLFHYTTRYPVLFPSPDHLLTSVPWGHYGVNLFFVISGYVIFMTISKVRRPLDFVVSRFSRLYPAYWLAVVLTFFLVAWKLPERHVTFTHFLVNLTMFQGFINIPHVDSVYWTLTVELSFYIIMAGLLLLNRLRQIEPIITVWLMLYVAWFVLPEHVKAPFAFKGQWMVEDFVFLHRHANLFIMGIAFNLLKKEVHWRLYALAGLCVASELALRDPNGFAACFVIFILFVLLTYDRLAFLRRGLFIFLGIISYPLYLIHQNIGFIIINESKSIGLNIHLAILLAFASSVLGATLIAFGCERPVMCWIRRRYEQIKRRTPKMQPIYTVDKV